MKKTVSLILALCLILTIFSGCGSTAVPGDTKTIEYTDDAGRVVNIPETITAIVPSGPIAQIILFALAPDMFVGSASKWGGAEGIIDRKYLDLPYFGQLYSSADLNVEALAAAGPQIVIDIGEAKGSVAEDLDALQSQTGIPCVFIESTLETLPETYRKLGALLGLQERAEELAVFCETVYDRTVSIMEQVGEDKPGAIYIPAFEGLSVLAAGSYHAEMIDMLTNNAAVMDEPMSKGTGNPVGMEQIALWDPGFIVFGTVESYATLETDPAWQELTAIKNGNYVLVPQTPDNWMGSPPSAQRYLGLIWLTAVLYPEYCDYDMKAEIFRFYELFFHCQLTEEQYAEITANAFTK